jgi:hypothetical protein
VLKAHLIYLPNGWVAMLLMFIVDGLYIYFS